MPLGGLRAPTRGWLTLTGRRGHHSYCDEVRAYDLATGAAYVHEFCDAFFLIRTADGKTAPKANARTIRAGRVPVSNLREAAWMMLVADKVGAPLVTEAGRAQIPAGMPFFEATSFGGSIGGRSYGSGQTILDWRYSYDDRPRAWGDLIWPEDLNNPARAHAAKLLKIAEAGFEEGCPPAPPPRHLALPAGPGDGRGATPKKTQVPRFLELWEGMMSAPQPSSCVSAPAAPKAR